MRVYFTALVVIILISSPAYSQYFWELKQSGAILGGPIDVEKYNSNNVYFGSSNRIYKSTDRGETFFQLGTNIPGAINIKNVILNDDNPSEFLVAVESAEGKIVKTTDAGESWVTVADSLIFTYFGIPTTPDPSHPNTIYAMDGDTLLRSQNFGDTWEIISSVPIPPDGPCDIEVFPDTSIILIGDNSVGIYRSTDYGETWEQTHNTTGEIPTIAIDYQTPGVAWASRWAGGGGVLKSADYGATWELQSFFSGQNMWGIHVHPNNSDYIIAGRFLGGVMFISNDGGRRWVSANTGSSNYQVYIVDTMTVFAAQGNGLWKLNSSYFIPVELISFTGELNDNKVLLEWSTAAENNNQGFNLEMSYDNYSFDNIAFIPGFGTTSERQNYSYTVDKIFSEIIYFRLKQIDFDGSFEYSSVIEINGSLPSEFSLSQNHPNPFNSYTSIKFSLPEESYVKILLYNMIGEEIRELTNTEYSAGLHIINFTSDGLASGSYLYLLIAKGSKGNIFSDTMKMLLLK